MRSRNAAKYCHTIGAYLCQRQYAPPSSQPPLEPKTRYYQEAGVYFGKGVKTVINDYDVIHGTEMSKEWYDLNTDRFKNEQNVTIRHGDSKTLEDSRSKAAFVRNWDGMHSRTWWQHITKKGRG